MIYEVFQGRLTQKNAKNQKKQSVQLFCLQNQWISLLPLSILEFRWKTVLSRQIFTLRFASCKNMPFKYCFPTQFQDFKWKTGNSLVFWQNNWTKYYYLISWLAEMLQSGWSSQYCTMQFFSFFLAFSMFYWSRKIIFWTFFNLIDFEFVGFETKWFLTR